MFALLAGAALTMTTLSGCQYTQGTTATKIVHSDSEASAPVPLGVNCHVKCRAFGAYTMEKARQLFLAGATNDSMEHYNLTRHSEDYGEISPDINLVVVGQHRVGMMNIHLVEVKVDSGKLQGKTMFIPRRLLALNGEEKASH